MARNDDTVCRVTVCLNEEELALLNERIDYLEQQRGVGSRVTKSEAIRHAICQTSYKRTGSKSGKNKNEVESENGE